MRLDPVRVLKQIALHLERAGEPTYKVRSFRRAAETAAELPEGELEQRVRLGTVTALPGIGKSIAAVLTDVVAGREPAYLTDIASRGALEIPDGGPLLPALRGDCHTHSDWSDGGSPIEEMAEAARQLGHEYVVLTDHSPRLTVANGLSAERLRRQLEVVAELNTRLAPFRILTGIEVDILDDGGLDQDPELLAELDLVVASVHSHLRMPAHEMTPRMVAAVSNPLVNVLGHCTGRLVTKRSRPESAFDADRVFAACRDHDVAVEVNSRPERLDPPLRLLRKARELGCAFSIDTDAHAPGQLGWLAFGTSRAHASGVEAAHVVNTRSADDLMEWARK